MPPIASLKPTRKFKEFYELDLPYQDAIMLWYAGYSHAEIKEILDKRYPREKGWALNTIRDWFRTGGTLRHIALRYEEIVGKQRLKKIGQEYAEADENILKISTNVMRLYGQRIAKMAEELKKPNPDLNKLRVNVFDFKTAFEIQRIIQEKNLGKIEIENEEKGISLHDIISKLDDESRTKILTQLKKILGKGTEGSTLSE